MRNEKIFLKYGTRFMPQFCLYKMFRKFQKKRAIYKKVLYNDSAVNNHK